MKNIILLLIAAALLYSCGSSLDHIRNDWEPKLKLTSSIKNENGQCNLIMSFQNLTADTVRLDNPECALIGITIWNEAGDTLDREVIFNKLTCEEYIVNLYPYTTEQYVYKKSLNTLYALIPKEKYNIRYIYYGNFLDKNGKAMYIKFSQGSDTTQFTYNKE